MQKERASAACWSGARKGRSHRPGPQAIDVAADRGLQRIPDYWATPTPPPSGQVFAKAAAALRGPQRWRRCAIRFVPSRGAPRAAKPSFRTPSITVQAPRPLPQMDQIGEQKEKSLTSFGFTDPHPSICLPRPLYTAARDRAGPGHSHSPRHRGTFCGRWQGRKKSGIKLRDRMHRQAGMMRWKTPGQTTPSDFGILFRRPIPTLHQPNSQRHNSVLPGASRWAARGQEEHDRAPAHVAGLFFRPAGGRANIDDYI